MFFAVLMSSRTWLNVNLTQKSVLSSPTGVESKKALNSFFSRIGIAHLVSCPHAHQQNGAAERKHRHIVEMGLSLLAHASMPLKFWDEAFLTATFVINRLPSKVIDHQTPYEPLLKKSRLFFLTGVWVCCVAKS